MKRLGSSILILGMVLAGCGPSGSDGKVSEGNAPTSEVKPEESVLGPDQAWVLAEGVVLAPSAEASEGAAVPLGSQVKVLEKSGTKTKVEVEGAQGWVPTAVLAVGARRGVLVVEAEGLPKLTLVGSSAPGAGSVEVWAAPSAGGTEAKSVTVKADQVSFLKHDVALAIQWRRADAEADGAVRAQKLEQALAAHASSVFASQVQAQIEELTGKPVAATEEFSQIATVVGSEVPVFSTAAVGQALEHLTDGQQVQTVERASALETVDGVQDRWYKISDPAGWVWGKHLKF